VILGRQAFQLHLALRKTPAVGVPLPRLITLDTTTAELGTDNIAGRSQMYGGEAIR
jgi:hypothetical protein